MKYENMEDLEFLIEEFVDGKIYSFDGIVDGKGRVDFIGSTEFELSVPPIMQQIGHTIPIYSLDPKQIGTGKNYIEKVVGVLNLKYCGFHGEVKYLKNQPVLIEISGRLPGGVITGAYQHLSKYNVFDKFLSVFDEGRREKLLVNKKSYKSETMKIIFSDKNMGIVKGGLGDVQKKRKDFVYKTRSRNEGEKINEKNNPFGIWLYEIVLRSKKLSSRKLVAERDCLIKEQEIQVVGINQGKAWLKQSFAKIGNKLIRKNDV